MNNPKISIIIPVYNAANYLPETLDSIFKQTFTDYEIILIDDGSKDNSKKIIGKYINKHPNKITYIYQENQGQSAARNNALKYIKGDYIAFIDSDDTISDTYFEKLYNAAENEKAQMAVCAFKAYNDVTQETLEERLTQDWTIYFDDTHKHVFQYSPWARLIKTDYINKYNFRFSNGEQMEDGPYCMMIDLLSPNTTIINSIEYFYRIRGNSTTDHITKSDIEPKVPYNGLKDAINTVTKNASDTITLQMLEFCSVKIMAGWVTRIYSNCNNSIRHKICDNCVTIMDTYFPNANNNPYFKINALPKLPFSHRIATKLFVLAYITNTMYLFSKITSLFIN